MNSKILETIKHFFIYGIGSVSQSAVTFLLLPFLTSKIETTQYGVYSLVVIICTIASAFFYLGVNSALPRSFFEYESKEEQKEVFSTSIWLTVFGAFLQVLFGVVFGDFIAQEVLGDSSYAFHLKLCLFAFSINFTNQIFFSLMRFERKSVQFSIIGLVSMLLNLGISLSLLFNTNDGILAPILGLTITNILVFLYLLFTNRQFIIFKVDKKEVSTQLSFGFPIILSSLAGMAIDWTDRFFINHYLSLSDVGIYSAGYKLGSIVNVLLVTPFVQIWNPIMMENRTADDVKELFKNVTLLFIFGGTLMILASSMIFPELDFLILPKKEYLPSFAVFPIIMCGFFLNGFVNILCAGLYYERKVDKLIWAYLAATVVNLFLNYLLIPKIGYIGAAWSSLITYACIPVFVYSYANKYFKIDFAPLPLILMFSFLAISLSTQRVLGDFDQAIRLVLKFVIIAAFTLSTWFLLPLKTRLMIRTRLAAIL